jgi:hypothetical protein
MSRRWVIALFLAMAIGAAGEVSKKHRDYVPDQKTAEHIAEAVLVAQFGEDRVHAQLPLHVDGSRKDYWLVQGYVHSNGIPKKGEGFAVWIDKNSGCIQKVLEHMK